VRFGDGESVIAGSRDGRTVLVRRYDSVGSPEYQLWDVVRGQPKGDVLLRDARINSAEFGPEGQYVVTGLYEQEVFAWNAVTGKAVGHLRHDGVVNSVAIGRDGQTVLTGSDDKTARLWEMQSGESLGQSLQHAGKVRSVALSPDGTLALTISVDGATESYGAAHLWDTRSCKHFADPLGYELAVKNSSASSDRNSSAVDCVEGIFSSDGSTILFICGDGTARLYDVPKPLPDDPAYIRAWTRARSGYVADTNGVPRKLSQSEWLEAQSELAELEDAR
jgi:WD40 repeat protein